MDFKKIENKWQENWEKTKLFEAEPDKRKKYYMLFAYPTVSGNLHIGHARSYAMPDIIARYKRMRGFNVFFPLGFHATGLDCERILNDVKRDVKNSEKHGIPQKDAIRFRTAFDIKNYLEKKMIEAFKIFGLSLDYRPAISTIDPPYNKFIQWQFRQLKRLGYLIQRDYRLTWCPKCNQPVSLDAAEMDIEEWKGAQIKDYTIIKFKLGDTVIPASTLRPETIFGVTNIWVKPDAKYIKAKVGNEEWIVSEKAIDKLMYLDKEVEILGDILGKELVNSKVKNPANNQEIPILEGEFVDLNEATGIVMSVPAHDPFDYIYLKKVSPQTKLIPVVSVKDHSIEKILDKYNIKYPSDPKIEEATKELYKIEYNGKMLDAIPMFGGMPVSKAKNEVANWLKRNRNADMIYELSVKPIYCRCGGEVIIRAVKGQWFIDYGNQKWKETTKKLIEKMNIYPIEYKKELSPIIDWLEARPCVRKRGLGTEFPFEKDWIIEALSDSTIYMTFFIVSKYLNSGTIRIEDLTDEFFDYVFLGRGQTKKQIWDKIRKEFEYWYPLDLNAGGKEHKAAHFPLFIMNHVAIFPENFWPRGIFVNWHLITYGKKMSKHFGNVVFWNDAIDLYGADTIRFYLSHGANQWEDFDWKNEECKIYKNHLENFYRIIEEIIKSKGRGDESANKWFKSRINRIIEEVTAAMEKNEIKKAIDLAFFSILNDVNWYKKRSKTYNKNIISVWIKLLSPFIPHISEEVWKRIGGKDSILKEEWPTYDPKSINLKVEVGEGLVRKVLVDISEIKRLSKIGKPIKITIFVSPKWKYEVYNEVFNGKELKEIISKTKGMEKDVSAYYQRLQKRKPLNEIFLTAAREFETLNEAKDFFERECKCKIEIIHSEKSKHPKALVSEPEKPGILVE
jgi:leucyl-tRNA synthetase